MDLKMDSWLFGGNRTFLFFHFIPCDDVSILTISHCQIEFRALLISSRSSPCAWLSEPIQVWQCFSPRMCARRLLVRPVPTSARGTAGAYILPSLTLCSFLLTTASSRLRLSGISTASWRSCLPPLWGSVTAAVSGDLILSWSFMMTASWLSLVVVLFHGSYCWFLHSTHCVRHPKLNTSVMVKNIISIP